MRIITLTSGGQHLQLRCACGCDWFQRKFVLVIFPIRISMVLIYSASGLALHFLHRSLLERRIPKTLVSYTSLSVAIATACLRILVCIYGFISIDLCK